MLLDQLLPLLNKSYLNSYRYLLVDPLKPVKVGEPLALINIKAVFPESSIEPILRPDLSYNIDFCPHLIQLGAPGEAIEKELLALCLHRCHQEQLSYKHYIDGWLCSEYSIKEVAANLVEAGLDIGSIIKPDKHYFFPFFEHVRLQLLQEGLQQNSGCFLKQFEFLQQYAFMNLYGELNSLTVASQDNKLPMLNSLLLSNVFSYQTEPKLVFNLTKIWLNNTPSQPSTPLLSAARAAANARQLGLTHNEDIIAFGLYSLLSTKKITSNSDVMDKITQAIDEPGSLNDSFGKLSSNVWCDLGMELKK